MTAPTEPLLARAQALKLHGLLAHWEAAELHKTAQGVLRRLAAKGVARAVAAADGARAWERA